MGERSIGDLLEEIDKAGKITVDELEKKGFGSGLIDRAGKHYDMIRLDRLPDRPIPYPINAYENVIVSPKGFEYLNPIKIKRAIEKFNESSDKSSKELIDLTEAIIVFTVIVAAIPLIEKINQLYNVNSPLSWIIGYFFMVIIIAALMMNYFKHYKKRA